MAQEQYKTLKMSDFKINWSSGFVYPQPGLGVGNRDALSVPEICDAIDAAQEGSEWQGLVDGFVKLYANQQPITAAIKEWTTAYASYSSNIVFCNTPSEQEQRKAFETTGLPHWDRTLAGIMPKEQLHMFLETATAIIDQELQHVLISRLQAAISQIMKVVPLPGQNATPLGSVPVLAH